jgi:hypothetical protein
MIRPYFLGMILIVFINHGAVNAGNGTMLHINEYVPVILPAPVSYILKGESIAPNFGPEGLGRERHERCEEDHIYRAFCG